MGIIKTLKQQGSELSKYDGRTPRDERPARLGARLRLQGSELSRYDGGTPAEARSIDPLRSSRSDLSAYGGLTPQPNFLTTDQSPLLYPYSLTGEARDQVQFLYGSYPNGSTTVLPLPTLLGVDIYANTIGYFLDPSSGYYGKTVGIGENPSRQTLSDGTLENRLTIAYTAKIADRDLGTSLDINPFGITTTAPPNILLEYNGYISSPEGPQLEYVRIQNPTIKLKDVYDRGQMISTNIYDNLNKISPLPGQKFDSHKEPVYLYNPYSPDDKVSFRYGASYTYYDLYKDNLGEGGTYALFFSAGDPLTRDNITIYSKPPNNSSITINYTNATDPSKPKYLTPGPIESANISWAYNPTQQGASFQFESLDAVTPDKVYDFLFTENYTTNILNRNTNTVFLNPESQDALADSNNFTFTYEQLQVQGNSEENSYFSKNTSLDGITDYRAIIKASSPRDTSLLPSTNYKEFNREFTYKANKTKFASELYSNVGLGEEGLLGNPNYTTYGNVDVLNTITPNDANEQTDEILEGFKNADLVKFFFEINNNDAPTNTKNWFLFFRAYINNLGDNFNSEWNPYKYVGRGETFYKYSGFSREISLDFTIYAHTRAEMIPLYEKLNYLVGTTAPSYSGMGYMRGNFVNLTIGDYIINTPGIIKSINLKPSLEAGWDLNRDETGKIIPLDQLPYFYGGEEKANYFVGQLPRLVDVTLTFTPIHSFTPQFGVNNDTKKLIADFIRNI